jgi:hypothetical protein
MTDRRAFVASNTGEKYRSFRGDGCTSIVGATPPPALSNSLDHQPSAGVDFVIIRAMEAVLVTRWKPGGPSGFATEIPLQSTKQSPTLQPWDVIDSRASTATRQSLHE